MCVVRAESHVDKALVAFVGFVVVASGEIERDQLVDGFVAFFGLAEGVVLLCGGREEVYVDGTVCGVFSLLLHAGELVVGPLRIFELDVDALALARDGIVEGRGGFFVFLLFGCDEGVGVREDFEGFLIVVLSVVE